jgi:hypothetical protein
MFNLCLTADELSDAKAKLPSPVLIMCDVTIVNLDKKTKQSIRIMQTFTLKEWESNYRPLTLLEVKTYDNKGYITAQPITLTIQTL